MRWKRNYVLICLLLAGVWEAFPESPPLIEAVYKKDVPQVRRLLAAGADVNQRDDDGSTALMRAAYLSEEITAVLLEAGADAGLVDARGQNALDYAVPGPWTGGLLGPQVVRLLLKAGADPNGGAAGASHLSPLWKAAGTGPLEIVWLLLAAGADTSARGPVGEPTQGMVDVGVVGSAQFFNQPAIGRFLVDRGLLRAVLNDSDVRVRDRPTTRGSRVITKLRKGDRVTVLGRGGTKVTIGNLTGYWLRIRLQDGRTGYAFGEFFKLDVFFQYDIPVYHGEDASSPPAEQLRGKGGLYRARRSTAAVGKKAAQSVEEEIEFMPEGSLRYTASRSSPDGLRVTRYGGTWVIENGWVMLSLEKGSEVLKAQGRETAPVPVKNEVRFLEWRPDVRGFLWSTDATHIESRGFRVNEAERRFEQRTGRNYEYTGWFVDTRVK